MKQAGIEAALGPNPTLLYQDPCQNAGDARRNLPISGGQLVGDGAEEKIFGRAWPSCPEGEVLGVSSTDQNDPVDAAEPAQAEPIVALAPPSWRASVWEWLEQTGKRVGVPNLVIGL